MLQHSDGSRPFVSLLNPGFKGYNERFQGFSAAKSWLMKNALSVVDGEVVIDPSLVKISSGSLPLPEDITCSFEEPNLVRFTWKPSGATVVERQQVMALSYNVDAGSGDGIVYGNGKSKGEQVVPIRIREGGTTVHCYLAVLATDRSNQSDSVYLGKFEIGYSESKPV